MAMIEILGTTIYPTPIAACGHCNQTGLRRTVRLLIDDREIVVGQDCAAKLIGQTQRTVWNRATAADKAARQAITDRWVTWNAARNRHVLAAIGLSGGAEMVQLAERAAAKYDAANPEPPKPAK